MKLKKKMKSDDFNKYFYYEASVQSPETDVKFFHKTYKKIRAKEARILREDFCGTHLISCEWVKLNSQNLAYGLDLDPEPIQYDRDNHEPLLTDAQRSRLHIMKRNVLDEGPPKADIIIAANFSYFLFKKERILRPIFKILTSTFSRMVFLFAL